MTTTDLIALIVTILGVASFAAVVTILFRNFIKSSIKEVHNGERDIELIDQTLYERNPKVIKKQRAAQFGKTAVYYAVLAVLIPLFGLSLYSRLKNNVTKFGDNAVMVVASGSMSVKQESNTYLFTYNLNNQFQTYDLITVSDVKSSSQLRLYDVIAFRNNKGQNVIHRIIDFDTTGLETRYVTRGDANAASDSYHPKFADVIGKYTNKRIPGIGVFVMFFQSYAGIVTIASVVYCTMMISHYHRKLNDETDARQEMLTQVIYITNLKEDDSLLMTSSHENCIYFNDTAYRFDETHLIEQRPMSDIEKELHNEKLKQEAELEEKQTKHKKEKQE